VDVEGRHSPDIDAFRAAALSCPIPAAIELVGEKWAFLILRGAFNGLQHFEEFQAGLGTARNILSDRLAKLVAGGILKRAPDPSDKRKVIYSLTEKGEALLPAVVAIRQWGEDWGMGEMQVVLADIENRRPIRRIKDPRRGRARAEARRSHLDEPRRSRAKGRRSGLVTNQGTRCPVVPPDDCVRYS
jgi:DNA-binding HxlR family transcriptional regulator